jgi:hypothetical protein
MKRRIRIVKANDCLSNIADLVSLLKGQKKTVR